MICLTLTLLTGLNASAQSGSKDRKFQEGLELAGYWEESVKKEADGDYDAALSRLKAYRMNDGDPFMVAMRLGHLRSLQENWEAASQSFEKAARINPKSVNARLGWMNVQIARKDNPSIIRGAQALLQVDPSNQQAMTLLATAHYERKDYRSAMLQFGKLLERYPMDVDALAYLASTQLLDNRKGAALVTGTRFATLLPGYAESGPLGAHLHAELGEYIAKNEPMREHWNQSVAAEAAGDLKKAFAHNQAYVQSGGDRYFGSMRAAWLSRSGNFHKEALKYYRQAAAIRSIAVNPRIGILAMQVAREDSAAIKRAQQALLRVKPNDYQTLLALADVPFAEEKHRRAEPLFEHLHKRYPLDITTLSYLSWSQYYNNHKRDAAESFVKLLSLSPDHDDAEKGLSYSLDRPYGAPRGNPRRRGR